MKSLLSLVIIGSCFADNTNLFNQALQSGQQHQFNLNLNNNSTLDSYGVSNKFTSTVATGANAGTSDARTMYNNSYGENANPNYLYNKGTLDIATCQNKADPRCSTLNKYGDKDTQTQLQAYSQSISTRNTIIVRPDPSTSSCSIVSRKVPINETIAKCISGNKEQNSCSSIITIGVSTHQCDPNKGDCNAYINDKECTLVQDYAPGKCIEYSYNANYGGCAVGIYSCYLPSVFTTPGCAGSHGRQYSCGSCSTGPDPGDHDGCWNQQCINFGPPQLAVYSCKSYNYSDSCQAFKS